AAQRDCLVMQLDCILRDNDPQSCKLLPTFVCSLFYFLWSAKKCNQLYTPLLTVKSLLIFIRILYIKIMNRDSKTGALAKLLKFSDILMLFLFVVENELPSHGTLMRAPLFSMDFFNASNDNVSRCTSTAAMRAQLPHSAVLLIRSLT
ncbi:unnamed protein product, partial [Acanthocheilonema viteae]